MRALFSFPRIKTGQLISLPSGSKEEIIPDQIVKFGKEAVVFIEPKDVEKNQESLNLDLYQENIMVNYILVENIFMMRHQHLV